eukprot:Opistho-2@41641
MSDDPESQTMDTGGGAGSGANSASSPVRDAPALESEGAHVHFRRDTTESIVLPNAVHDTNSHGALGSGSYASVIASGINHSTESTHALKRAASSGSILNMPITSKKMGRSSLLEMNKERRAIQHKLKSNPRTGGGSALAKQMVALLSRTRNTRGSVMEIKPQDQPAAAVSGQRRMNISSSRFHKTTGTVFLEPKKGTGASIRKVVRHNAFLALMYVAMLWSIFAPFARILGPSTLRLPFFAVTMGVFAFVTVELVLNLALEIHGPRISQRNALDFFVVVSFIADAVEYNKWPNGETRSFFLVALILVRSYRLCHIALPIYTHMLEVVRSVLMKWHEETPGALRLDNPLQGTYKVIVRRLTMKLYSTAVFTALSCAVAASMLEESTFLSSVDYSAAASGLSEVATLALAGAIGGNQTVAVFKSLYPNLLTLSIPGVSNYSRNVADPLDGLDSRTVVRVYGLHNTMATFDDSDAHDAYARSCLAFAGCAIGALFLACVIFRAAAGQITNLLQMACGLAGSTMVTESLFTNNQQAAMMLGTKVNGVFGFCDIRQFTDATEILKEDVMMFVNKISTIVHTSVSEYGGHPNKNVGDAFLTVWKFGDLNAHRSMRRMADGALLAVLQVWDGISMSETLSYLSNRIHKVIPTYSVRLGFGLHVGWAIEGAIGSLFKFDASYLSPHVNLSARLEGATKQYGVDILISGQFYSLLSPDLQELCVKVDHVTLKGSKSPIYLYTLNAHLVAEGQRMGMCVIDTPPGETSKLARYSQDAAVEEYIKGDWVRAKELLVLADSLKTPYGRVLNSFMEANNFVPPKDWKGYRELLDK